MHSSENVRVQGHFRELTLSITYEIIKVLNLFV